MTRQQFNANGNNKAVADAVAAEEETSRAPTKPAASALAARVPVDARGDASDGAGAMQRYFRIPMTRPSDRHRSQADVAIRGWWYAHFDGRYIVRQMELLDGKQPVLLVAGEFSRDLQLNRHSVLRVYMQIYANQSCCNLCTHVLQSGADWLFTPALAK